MGSINSDSVLSLFEFLCIHPTHTRFVWNVCTKVEKTFLFLEFIPSLVFSYQSITKPLGFVQRGSQTQAAPTCTFKFVGQLCVSLPFGCKLPSTSYAFLATYNLCSELYEAAEGHLLHLLFSKLEQGFLGFFPV